MKMVLAVVMGLGVSAWGQVIDVPAGQTAVLTVQGRGAQIYKCVEGSWVFDKPDADLFVDGLKVGSHGAGPVWTYKDGSSVMGKKVSAAASRDGVDWLLLSGVGGAGNGLLSGVSYIVRSKTQGGKPEAGKCEAGAVSRMDYFATYTFYKSNK